VTTDEMTQREADPTPSNEQRRLGRRSLVRATRSDGNDHALAVILAAVAGAANAGGFFAVSQYTSHMTGYLSLLADDLAVAEFWLAFISCLAISAFVTGAAFSSILIIWAREHHSHHQYSLPIAVQGGLLVCFSAGWIFTSEAGRLFSIACLCFIMGMQNATVTKLSGARIRTTHVTGMVTDIGIEIGRAVFGFWRRRSAVRADHAKLGILLSQVGAFLIGGIIGALGYKALGFLFSLPLAAVLLSISVPHLLFERAEPPAP
jgi:uncharacterized membrane protein YoaK (UPF0700 family)